MSLLHMLKEKSGECGFSLSVVNCEHGIRGKSSLADSRFVEEIAATGKSLSIPSPPIVPPKRKKKKSVWKPPRESFVIVVSKV